MFVHIAVLYITSSVGLSNDLPAMYQAQSWQMAQRGLQMQGMAASGQDRQFCVGRRGLGSEATQDQDWRPYYQQ